MMEEQRNKEWKQHLIDDKAFQVETLAFQKNTNERQDKLDHAIFGKDDEKGMKDKVDEMHAFFVQGKAVSGFFGWVKNAAAWVLVMWALISIFKK